MLGENAPGKGDAGAPAHVPGGTWANTYVGRRYWAVISTVIGNSTSA